MDKSVQTKEDMEFMAKGYSARSIKRQLNYFERLSLDKTTELKNVRDNPNSTPDELQERQAAKLRVDLPLYSLNALYVDYKRIYCEFNVLSKKLGKADVGFAMEAALSVCTEMRRYNECLPWPDIHLKTRLFFETHKRKRNESDCGGDSCDGITVEPIVPRKKKGRTSENTDRASENTDRTSENTDRTAENTDRTCSIPLQNSLLVEGILVQDGVYSSDNVSAVSNNSLHTDND
jgi:hypothetical protein